MAGMRALLALVVLAVNLGGSFGEATGATVTLGPQTMLVDLEVEVLVAAQSVAAHLSLEGEEMVVPLLHRGEGVYGIRTELPRKDYVVVFEVLAERSVLSSPTTLSSLGVQLTVVSDTTVPADEDDDGFSRGTRSWGWLALALGAASLSTLALWALGGRRESPEGPSALEEE